MGTSQDGSLDLSWTAILRQDESLLETFFSLNQLKRYYRCPA